LDAQLAGKVHWVFAAHPNQGRQPRHSPRYSYTLQSMPQVIFLACCFKHDTGQYVS
jgi:hypothetical protein